MSPGSGEDTVLTPEETAAQEETGDDNSGFQLVTLESALFQGVIELRGGTTLPISGKSLFQT